MLRRDDPVHLVESADFLPFHVLTKHADVLEVELHNKEWENAPRPGRDDQRRRGASPGARRDAAHADPHGRPRPPRLPGDDRRVVPAQEPGQARRPAGRAGQAVRRHDGGQGRRVRLRPGHRDAVPAAGDPGHPRAARERLPAHAAADPGAVRVVRRGAVAWPVDGRPDGGHQRLLRLLHPADRGPPGPPDRRPRVGHRQRHDRRRAGRDHGDDLVLRDHRDRRPRHDGVVDGRWAARPDRAPRSAAAAARRPVADPDRGRRDHPLGHAGQALHAQLHDALRAARRTASSPATW